MRLQANWKARRTLFEAELAKTTGEFLHLCPELTKRQHLKKKSIFTITFMIGI